jgi:hypothetical protein
MRILSFFSACLCALLAVTPARALPTSRTFAAYIDEGTSGLYMGSLRFDLVFQMANTCRYVMEWNSTAGAPSSTICWLDEDKVAGDGDCATNAGAYVSTMVRRASNLSCTGFNTAGEETKVDKLTLGELEDGLAGMIEFGSSSGITYSFWAVEDP